MQSGEGLRAHDDCISYSRILSIDRVIFCNEEQLTLCCIWCQWHSPAVCIYNTKCTSWTPTMPNSTKGNPSLWKLLSLWQIGVEQIQTPFWSPITWEIWRGDWICSPPIYHKVLGIMNDESTLTYFSVIFVQKVGTYCRHVNIESRHIWHHMQRRVNPYHATVVWEILCISWSLLQSLQWLARGRRVIWGDQLC